MTFHLITKLLLGLAGSKAWLALALGSVGVGGGYGQTSGHTSSSSVPPFLKPFELQLGKLAPQLLAQFNAANDPNKAAVEQNVSRDLSGYWLDPATNPTLAPSVNAIETEANRNLGRNVADINRSAAGSGTLLSTKTAQAGDEAARLSQQDVTAQLAQLYGQNYSNERANMINAEKPAMDLSQLPLDQAEQLYKLITAAHNKTATRGTNWDVSGSAGTGGYGGSKPA